MSKAESQIRQTRLLHTEETMALGNSLRLGLARETDPQQRQSSLHTCGLSLDIRPYMELPKAFEQNSEGKGSGTGPLPPSAPTISSYPQMPSVAEEGIDSHDFLILQTASQTPQFPPPLFCTPPTFPAQSPLPQGLAEPKYKF